MRSPVRSPIRLLGGEPRAGDLFDANSLVRAAEGADVVIHAATAIPLSTKPTPKDWEMNNRIRVDGTRALAGATAELVRAEVRHDRIRGIPDLEDTLVALHLAILAARPWHAG